MKFFVISDTHGKIEEAEAVCRGLKGIDRIFHLGDHYRDGLRLSERLGIPVTAVKGNMDGSYSKEDHKVFDTEWGKILLTHGHIESVKYSLDALMYKAEALECKAVIFGHTHVPRYLEESGLIVLNPGSPSHPIGSRAGSYAVVETHPREFKAAISYIDLNVLKQNGDCPAEDTGAAGNTRDAGPAGVSETAGTSAGRKQSKQYRSAIKEVSKADPGRNGPAEGGSLRDLLNHSDRF